MVLSLLQRSSVVSAHAHTLLLRLFLSVRSIGPAPSSLVPSHPLRAQLCTSTVTVSPLVGALTARPCTSASAGRPPDRPPSTNDKGAAVKATLRLRRLLTSNMHAQAQEHFDYLCARRMATVQHYNTMLTHTPTPAACRTLLAAMAADGVHPDTATFTIVAQKFSRVSDVAGLSDVYFEYSRRVEEGSLIPDARFYQIVMNGLGRAGDWERVDGILRDTEGLGVALDVPAYTAALSTFAARGDVEKVGEILDMMERMGVEMTSATLSVALRACRRAEDVGLLESVLAKCPERDDNVTHALLEGVVDHHVELRQREQQRAGSHGTHTQRKTKQQQGSIPTAQPHHYSLVHIPTIRRSFDEICRHGTPGPRTYGLLATVVGHAGDVLGMEMVVEDMKLMGVPLTRRVYNEILSVYIRMSSEFGLRRSREILREMEDNRIDPDATTYSLMAQGYAAAGDFDSLETSLRAVHSLGITLDPRAYIHCITSYARAGKIAEAESMLNSIIERGVRFNDSCYRALVNVFCRLQRQGTVETLFRQMQTEGWRPGVEIFTSLLNTCAVLGDVTGVERIFSTMQSVLEGRLDAKAFAPLMFVNMRYNNEERVRELQKLMRDMDIAPNKRITDDFTRWEELNRRRKERGDGWASVNRGERPDTQFVRDGRGGERKEGWPEDRRFRGKRRPERNGER